MAIGLGSSAVTQDSRHTFLMIIFVQAFYFLSLGLCLVMYEQQLSTQPQPRSGLMAAVSSASSDDASSNAPAALTASPPPAAAAGKDVLSLSFLFTAGSFPMHPHHAVLLVYLLHGLMLGFCIGMLVERRTWCLDMVLTVEGIFLFATLFVAGFAGFGWRLACLALDSACALSVALYVAGRRESAEVAFGPPQATTTTVVV